TGGVSLEEMVLANALGYRPPPAHLGRPSGVLMLHAERAGTLQAVGGKAEAAAMPGITGLTITVPVGQRVHPLPEGDRYLGFIFAEADTPQDTAAALRAARSQLRLTIGRRAPPPRPVLLPKRSSWPNRLAEAGRRRPVAGPQPGRRLGTGRIHRAVQQR